MIIVKLKGGFGNQMFQYATGKALAIKNNTELQLDLSFLNRMGKGYVKRDYKKNEIVNYELIFLEVNNNFAIEKNIPFFERIKNRKLYNFCSKLKRLFKLFKKNNYFLETQFNYDETILDFKSGYIEGYFQSEKYFYNYKNEIKKDFEFRIKKPSEKNEKIMIKIKNSNSISIHVRRGDYIENKSLSYIYGTCDLNYYKNAIDIIRKKIDNPAFFLFSDDIEWVKKNLKIKDKTYYIDWNDNNTCYEDMRLMSTCKHNIIANSSFSWWGAWLNNNKNKVVIAPKKWFNNSKNNYSDVIPESWFKV